MSRQEPKKKRHISYRVALGGIVAALCLMTMLMAGVVPILYIAAPMVAGLLLVILVQEVSTGWAALTYAATAVLSVFVVPDREATLMFVLFFGYYPLLRPRIKKLPTKLLRLFAKLGLYLLFLVVDYLLTVYVLGMPTFDEFPAWALPLIALAATAVFLMYDSLIDDLTLFYTQVVRRRLKR